MSHPRLGLRRVREKMRVCTTPHRAGDGGDGTARIREKVSMDAERTNALRNQLADLTDRVAELRRYL
jgi:hypothetical protein